MYCECPTCNKSMELLGQPHWEANGDVFTYFWCNGCRGKYEVIEDALFGGTPIVTKIK